MPIPRTPSIQNVLPLLILLCVGASAGWAADTPEVPGQIRLASEAWNDYTNADGSGLAWDVLR